mmetsp:Transcript_39515/g.39971  ORF Transcript_39515/g.39971 Transcript_39515/m.39971 type:complete len:244 (+) Transcript_39515:86-817(+)
MKVSSKRPNLTTAVSIVLLSLLLFLWDYSNDSKHTNTAIVVVDALTIGRRRILSSTPIGGKEDVDALMDPKPTLPLLTGFVGIQILLPALAKCPTEVSIQPPWFSGNPVTAGGGLCPLEYIHIDTCVPGVCIMLASVVWNSYIQSNDRLVITNKGIGTTRILDCNNNDNNKDDHTTNNQFKETVLFSDVTNWFMTPIGLVVQSTTSSSPSASTSAASTMPSLFPLYWDSKSVETILKARIISI